MKRNNSKAKSRSTASKPNDLAAQNAVYSLMSGHYRRMMNITSVVDTSPPRCYRPHGSSERSRSGARRSRVDAKEEPSPTQSDLELLDEIVYDKRHGPGQFYRDSKRNIHWPAGHDKCRAERASKQPPSYKQEPYKPKPSTFKLPVYPDGKRAKPSANRPPPVPPDIMDQHKDSFEEDNPRILKSDAKSRVRELKVYHPPRRRSKRTSSDARSANQRWPPETVDICEPAVEWILEKALSNKQMNEDRPPSKTFVECRCKDGVNPEPSSKMSVGSHDSAYVGSGGESRGASPEQVLPAKSPSVGSAGESRGSTPEQMSSDQSPVGSSGEGNAPSPEESVAKPGLFSCFGKSPRRDSPYSAANESSNEAASEEKESPQKDDFRYATFSHEITQDILLRGIYSDKGMNAVFNRHIQENEHLLDMDLMQKEVSSLRRQLSVAEPSASTTSITHVSSRAVTSASREELDSDLENVSSRPLPYDAIDLHTHPSLEDAQAVPSHTSLHEPHSILSQHHEDTVANFSPNLGPSGYSPSSSISRYNQDDALNNDQFCNNVSEDSDDDSSSPEVPNEPSAESIEQKGSMCCWGGGSKKKKKDNDKVSEQSKPVPKPRSSIEGKRVSSDDQSLSSKKNVTTIMTTHIGNNPAVNFFGRNISNNEKLKDTTAKEETNRIPTRSTDGERSNTSPRAADASSALLTEDRSLRECNIPSSLLIADAGESLGYVCDPAGFDDEILLYSVMHDKINFNNRNDLEDIKQFRERTMSTNMSVVKPESVLADPSYKTIVETFAGWPDDSLDERASVIVDNDIACNPASASASSDRPPQTSLADDRNDGRRRAHEVGPTEKSLKPRTTHQLDKPTQGELRWTENQGTSKGDEIIDGNASDIPDSIGSGSKRSQLEGTYGVENTARRVEGGSRKSYGSYLSSESETGSISELPELIRRFTSQEIKMAPHGIMLPKSSFEAKDVRKKSI